MAFRFHFSRHHKAARRRYMIDTKYFKPMSKWLVDEEVLGLLFLAILHLPLVLVFPYAYGTLVCCSVLYFLVHRAAHVDMEWARDNVPWHYDHHMGPDQHLNWGVRLPFVDYLFGTRKKYKGTPKEAVKYVIAKNKF